MVQHSCHRRQIHICPSNIRIETDAAIVTGVASRFARGRLPRQRTPRSSCEALSGVRMTTKAYTKSNLQEQASKFLKYAQIERWLTDFSYYFTGSFELRTMAWPDIDVNVLYTPSRRPGIFAFGADCLRYLAPSWFELRCTENQYDSPGHFFLGFEVRWGNTLWNVDIWFLSKVEYEAGIRWLHRTFQQMDSVKRETIINLKRFLMERKVYPNGIPSIDLYKAVLEKHVDPSTFESWYLQYQRRRQ